MGIVDYLYYGFLCLMIVVVGGLIIYGIAEHIFSISGTSSGKVIDKLYTPRSHGVSEGWKLVADSGSNVYSVSVTSKEYYSTNVGETITFITSIGRITKKIIGAHSEQFLTA